MSENEAPSQDDAPEQPAQDAEQPQPKVDEVDWKAKAREWERRAKDNKTAADELAQIKESQKSEAEKAAERLSAAEKRAEAAESAVLRFKIAAKHGISDEDATEFLTGTDEETLTRQAERLSKLTSEASKPRTPKPDPNQGTSGNPAMTTADQFAAALGDF